MNVTKAAISVSAKEMGSDPNGTNSEKCPQVTAWQLCRTACNPAAHEVFA
ncbi:MAG: hypothetical protein K8H75_00530 [Sulfuricella sp.]|nr:hypothetical protein [Sulfuricella sp.]